MKKSFAFYAVKQTFGVSRLSAKRTHEEKLYRAGGLRPGGEALCASRLFTISDKMSGFFDHTIACVMHESLEN
jgi:hypothetical protein